MKLKRYGIYANGIRQHVVEAGEGPPVVLLHGFPETNFAWRFQIPVLAERYRVIAPDLRGYGETEKPATGYDKRNMALDLRELMKELQIEKIALVGHDRGARVSTRFAKDYPDLIDRLVVMDNVPTRIVARDLDAKVAKAYWFFLSIWSQIFPRPSSQVVSTSGSATSFQTGATTQQQLAARRSTPMCERFRRRAPFVARCRTIGQMRSTSRKTWKTPM
ncbi:MAG: alpha/beta hydrolase [Rhizobium sp.]|uniref:alpha/beta fold hydrolase n=1 Tax=Rhizobium sp. TaxID=391 RepID=UPI0030F03EA4